MTTSEVLRAAAKRLREQGWQQGGYGDWAGYGPCCLAGALMSATEPNTGDDTLRNYDAAKMAVWKQLERGADIVSGPIAWNDKPGRTAEEVIALLEDTAAELERSAP